MSSPGDHEKSAKNRVTEKAGLAVLLADAKGRFQAPDTAAKKELLKHFGLGEDSANYGAQSFDAVYSDTPVPTLTAGNVAQFAERLHIVEMKTTKKPIPDSSLAGFFFGATEREYKLAEKLGDRFRFAFVVLNAWADKKETIPNAYGRPFAVLLTHDELVVRTQTKRVQFQVNLKSKKAGAKVSPDDFVV